MGAKPKSLVSKYLNLINRYMIDCLSNFICLTYYWIANQFILFINSLLMRKSMNQSINLSIYPGINPFYIFIIKFPIF